MFKTLKKWQLNVISGVLGIILAVIGIYDNFIPWLNTLGVLIPPMGGVIAVDYYLFNKKYYEVEYLKKVDGLRKISLASWILGSLVSFITGNGIITLSTVPALDGFIVAGIAQYLIIKCTKQRLNSTFFESKQM